MSFQMVLLLLNLHRAARLSFGTMSFQMVLLLVFFLHLLTLRFGTMSFQMVLLLLPEPRRDRQAFWNYVIPDGSTTHLPTAECVKQFWNYVIPDGFTTDSSA